MGNEALIQKAKEMIRDIEQIEAENNSNINTLKKYEEDIERLKETIVDNQEALDIASHALEIIQNVSDEVVQKAYSFLETNINAVLERTFTNSIRRIKITEFLLRNQYPQLEIELDVGNGIKRTLKTDSGHGIAQIVSVLSIICIIILTGSRRLLVMDEIISGVSAKNKEILSDIMWTFTEIGFQFICVEHGFIPKGAKVYKLEMKNDVSGIVDEYIELDGVYNEIKRKSKEDIEESVDGDFSNFDSEQLKPNLNLNIESNNTEESEFINI